MKFMKISAPNSNVFSMYVSLNLCSILPKNCEKPASRIPKEIQQVRILYTHFSSIPLFAPKKYHKEQFL